MRQSNRKEGRERKREGTLQKGIKGREGTQRHKLN